MYEKAHMRGRLSRLPEVRGRSPNGVRVEAPPVKPEDVHRYNISIYHHTHTYMYIFPKKRRLFSKKPRLPSTVQFSLLPSSTWMMRQAAIHTLAHGAASTRSRPYRLRMSQARTRVGVQPRAAAVETGGSAELEQKLNTAIVGSSVAILDAVYADPKLCYARFFVLETVARIPYFGAWRGRRVGPLGCRHPLARSRSLTPSAAPAFVSVLHLYETLGWWKRSDYLKARGRQERRSRLLGGVT